MRTSYANSFARPTGRALLNPMIFIEKLQVTRFADVPIAGYCQ